MTDDASSLARAKPATAACPICGQPAHAATRPFCSRRCADIDLARWLNGVYQIPVAEAEDEEDEASGAAPAPPPR